MRPLHAILRLILFPIALTLLQAAPTFAQNKASEPVRVVLKGHDPVAYFTAGRPVKGSTEFRFDWDGERYHFSSAANRDLFAANPEKYAPQFGGYCTGSMSRKIQNEADPGAWIISDGKLYVFGQPKFAEQARKDPEYLRTRVPLAAVNWRERGK